jgi:DNA-binding transcriptional MerR regulator
MQNYPHKIGAVSSLSGVPTPTLRIWESRYATFQPHKTETNHRLYTEDDVLKAILLKRLTEQGHAISAIAKFSTTALNNLLQKQQAANHTKSVARHAPQPVSIAIVSLTLASRIESKKFTLDFSNHAIRVTDIFSSIADALLGNFQEPPQILLIHTNSLHAGVQFEIHRLAEKNQALQVIVLYNFGQEPVIQSMKECGMIVRREPISDSELADLINSVLVVDTSGKSGPLKSGTLIPQRKYSDMALMKVARISSNVLCECPKHVAEIISQLASFEQYSHECLNKSNEDAHLHAHLSAISGSARALFESALEMVAKHEGIDLDALTKNELSKN